MSPATAPQPQPTHARGGFTLFEVALALGLVTFGVVSTLMLFPAGLKAQQLARFKIYASAKALEMVDAYNSFHNQNPASDIEAPNAWDVHTTYKGQAPDLESRLASYRNGLLPLPLTIARRLDSDGDEIQNLLAQGGYLYYSQPLATTGLNETAFGTSMPPNEAQRLVIGVIGFPQNNAIPALPQKAWPYYTPYPSPPVHVQHVNTDIDGADYWSGPNCYAWEPLDRGDTAMKTVYDKYKDYFSDQTLPKAVIYAKEALNWCDAKRIPLSYLNGTDKITVFAASPSGDNLWQQVTGLRMWAHAATTAFHWASSQTVPTGQAAPTTIDIAGNVTVTLSEQSVRTIHDACLALGMRFQATHPFDFGCPRPLQRALMMDFPLIEFDVGSAPLGGTIFANGAPAHQWRPVATSRLTSLGVSAMYPNPASSPVGAMDQAALGTSSSGTGAGALWGNDPSHATLTASFTAAERCRQIVFWTADWQSYDDFETAPSAPVDASKYLKGAPRGGATFDWCMTHPPFMDWQQYTYRNPEKVLAFINSGRTATGSNDSNGTGVHDQGSGSAAVFSGLYGADRNGNGKADQGTVPPSVRLRAQVVARFNYYDLRVPAVIR
ncbi:MAG: hypothetical protein H0X38_01210 [Planctomycetes bacterium]|nr:hypothetical protein [Planctomycetota bacterium]